MVTPLGNNVLQFSPKLFFLGSTLLESLIPIKLLKFSVLLFFIYASGLQNKCTKDPPSPAQPRAILHLFPVTEPDFPRENFVLIKPEFDIWLGLLDIWHTQGSAGKLSHVCSVQTSTAHSPHSAPEPVQEQWIYCACAGQIIHGNGLK